MVNNTAHRHGSSARESAARMQANTSQVLDSEYNQAHAHFKHTQATRTHMSCSRTSPSTLAHLVNVHPQPYPNPNVRFNISCINGFVLVIFNGSVVSSLFNSSVRYYWFALCFIIIGCPVRWFIAIGSLVPVVDACSFCCRVVVAPYYFLLFHLLASTLVAPPRHVPESCFYPAVSGCFYCYSFAVALPSIRRSIRCAFAVYLVLQSSTSTTTSTTTTTRHHPLSQSVYYYQPVIKSSTSVININ
eukprot:TRINITY_DN11632_c0_g1_i1.p2 TRINITY_DN11632_c0_g1~~TRINITY_DN11632_c0_g1_i1.p2  ORF type:complete len:245 (+),score=-33.37 TRINITY_DN11632_c0_g1_i1:158-892(+)